MFNSYNPATNYDNSRNLIQNPMTYIPQQYHPSQQFQTYEQNTQANYSQSTHNIYNAQQNVPKVFANQYNNNNFFNANPNSSHFKSYSLPANLPESQMNQLMCNQLPPPANRASSSSVDIPLPQGWTVEKVSSGQMYYINHMTKTTSWEDPRKFYNLPTNQNELTNDMLLAITKIPLPNYWEEARTPTGKPYFINHNTKVTTWDDPRISIYMQQQMNLIDTRSSSSKSTTSLSSTSSSSSSTSSVLFDASNIKRTKKDSIIKNLDDLQVRRKTILQQIEELTKKESQLRMTLTQDELNYVFTMVNSNEPIPVPSEIANNMIMLNKENIADLTLDTSIENNENLDNSDMDRTLVTDTSVNSLN